MPSYNALVGLGHEHQADRKAKVAALAASPGQPCPHLAICGGAPMYATPTEGRAAGLPPVLWHVDLDHYPGRIFGGPQVTRLAHQHCNRKAGQALGARLRKLGIRRPVRKPRQRPGRARRSRW